MTPPHDPSASRSPLRWLTPKPWLLQRDRLTHGLEIRWVNPSYSGWVLIGLGAFFFLAASNTMAGWLYVMSGVTVALLAIATYLARRSLKGLTVTRSDRAAFVSTDQPIPLSLAIENSTSQPKTLLELQEGPPLAVESCYRQAIALIPARDRLPLRYSLPGQPRGILRWETLTLRSAAPLGLLWHRRTLEAPFKAVVSPPILPLDRCSLVDSLGQEQNPNLLKIQRSQTANEGLTRALRPYRWGDPIRMVHWRTSARYGELRVRELETLQAGEDIVFALDDQHPWFAIPELNLTGLGQLRPQAINSFEQAVVALASLYRYASRYQSRVALWTQTHGLLRGDRPILEALAGIQPPAPTPQTIRSPSDRPQQPLIWLTQTPNTLSQLPPGSRWLLWPHPAIPLQSLNTKGLTLDPPQPLQFQLQF